MLRCVNTRRPCGTKEMPSCTISCVAAESRSPRQCTSPSTTGARPMIAFSTVDLPAPFGPISATTSPRCTSSETPLSATTAP